MKIMAALIALMLLAGCARPGAGEGAGYPGGDFTVTLSVSVHTLLDNMHRLDREKHELVPGDGVIFAPAQVWANQGDSAFDVLHREMRAAGIHLAFRITPFLDSAYVEAIHNIFEFDAGELSGWMYLVGGQAQGVGASQHELSPGDVIQWVYTLDLGRDLNGYGPWS